MRRMVRIITMSIVSRSVVRQVFRVNFPLTRTGTIEHVAPQSLYPSLKNDVNNMLWLPSHLNNARGNKRLCVSTTRSTWEPPDTWKGMYARSVLHTRAFEDVLDEELALEWHHTFAPTPAERRAFLSLGVLQQDVNELYFFRGPYPKNESAPPPKI